jgi:hypothetical protein
MREVGPEREGLPNARPEAVNSLHRACRVGQAESGRVKSP